MKDHEIGEYTGCTHGENGSRKYGYPHVPFLGTISLSELNTLDDFKAWSKGESLTPGVQREGVVFKSTEDGHIHFKCINDEWLLKNE